MAVSGSQTTRIGASLSGVGTKLTISAKAIAVVASIQISKINGIDIGNVVNIVTGNYSPPASAHIVCNNTGNITITLPTLASNIRITVIRANSGGVTIDGDGTNISGASTKVLSSQYDAADILGTTLQWLLIQ